MPIGSFLLPIAAIPGEGTFNDYLSPEAPLPAFEVQRATSEAIRGQKQDYFTGVAYSTNRRVWEHGKRFRDYLKRIRCNA